MDFFWIPDPDLHNNRCGSATLMFSFGKRVENAKNDLFAVSKFVTLQIPVILMRCSDWCGAEALRHGAVTQGADAGQAGRTDPLLSAEKETFVTY